MGLACVALMARAIGAGDAAGARRVLTASVQVAAVVTLVLIAIMIVGARPILAVLGAEQAVVDAAIPYLNLIVGSSMILAISLVLDSALRANRDMRTPMWIATGVTVVKLAGNWVLIFGHLGAPRLELLGAGLATVISQVVGLALFLAVMRRQPHDSPVRFSWRTPGAAAARREVVRIALPGIAERILMNLAMLSYFFEAPIVWVWYALIFDHVARAAFMVWSFRRGRWKTWGANRIE